jgi:hypothetical protein
VDYREWWHGERDPRDRATAHHPWSAEDEPDDDEYPAYRTDRSFGWNSGTSGWGERGPAGRDNGDHWSNGRYRDDPGHPTGGWAAEHTGSWRTDPGWVPRQRPATHSEPRVDDSGYLTDPRYGAEPPDPRYPPPRWGSGRILDHDDWYELPSAGRLPATRRPAEMVSRPRPPRRIEPDLDEDDEPGRGYLAAMFMTIIWYAVPVGLYLLWALALGNTPEANCLDAAGNPCGSPRAAAFHTLMDAVPRLGTALALSLTIALLIRWVTGSWRAITVGFAGAVVGASIATVTFSLIGTGGTG